MRVTCRKSTADLKQMNNVTISPDVCQSRALLTDLTTCVLFFFILNEREGCGFFTLQLVVYIFYYYSSVVRNTVYIDIPIELHTCSSY
jgi:hypothetical protein